MVTPSSGTLSVNPNLGEIDQGILGLIPDLAPFKL